MKARDELRRKAHAVFHAALRRGDIRKPKACSECGRRPKSFMLRAHHVDHALPLDVEWLCTKCHGGRNLEAYLARVFTPEEWSVIVAKARRTGISLRALTLTLWREWLERGD